MDAFDRLVLVIFILSVAAQAVQSVQGLDAVVSTIFVGLSGCIFIWLGVQKGPKS